MNDECSAQEKSQMKEGSVSYLLHVIYYYCSPLQIECTTPWYQRLKLILIKVNLLDLCIAFVKQKTTHLIKSNKMFKTRLHFHKWNEFF